MVWLFLFVVFFFKFDLEFLSDIVSVRVSLLFFGVFLGCENNYFIVSFMLFVLICFSVFLVRDLENFIFMIIEIVDLFGGGLVMRFVLLLMFFIFMLEKMCFMMLMILVMNL